MQRFVFFAVVFVLFASSAQAGRMLTQQPTVTPTILMTHVGGKQTACSATITLKGADGAAVPDASIIYKWNSAAVGRTAISNGLGRFATMERVSSEATSCTLQIISVSVAGVPQRIAIPTQAARTVSWV